MKIMITGGAGLLGQYLNIALSKDHDILTLYNNKMGNTKYYRSACIDLTDFTLLTGLFESYRPQAVIHTASVSSAEMALAFPESYVRTLNVDVTAKIAQLCAEYNTKLFYTSTDLVYDGSIGKMLPEDSPLRPVSLYAETKLMGEEAIRDTFDNFVILRTAILYGFGLNHSTNHFQKMYDNLRSGKSVRLFYDQFRTPLALSEAAGIIAELPGIDIRNEIINLGGAERLSRFEMGEVLCEEAGLRKELLVKTSINDFPNLPVVPDISMDTGKLRRLGIEQPSYREGIKKLLNNS